MNWMMWNMDDKLKAHILELNDPVGAILLGRKMTDGFITHWRVWVTKPSDPQFALARKMVETPKGRVHKNAGEIPWKNTVLANGNLSTEINKLKKQEGGTDIIVYGGAGLFRLSFKKGLSMSTTCS